MIMTIIEKNMEIESLVIISKIGGIKRWVCPIVLKCATEYRQRIEGGTAQMVKFCALTGNGIDSALMYDECCDSCRDIAGDRAGLQVLVVGSLAWESLSLAGLESRVGEKSSRFGELDPPIAVRSNIDGGRGIIGDRAHDGGPASQ